MAIAGFLSGLAIVGIYESTLPTITANKARELREAVFKVLPGIASLQKLNYRDGSLARATEDSGDESTVYGGYDSEGVRLGLALIIRC